jgi:hypothetical protein
LGSLLDTSLLGSLLDTSLLGCPFGHLSLDSLLDTFMWVLFWTPLLGFPFQHLIVGSLFDDSLWFPFGRLSFGPFLDTTLGSLGDLPLGSGLDTSIWVSILDTSLWVLFWTPVFWFPFGHLSLGSLLDTSL